MAMQSHKIKQLFWFQRGRRSHANTTFVSWKHRPRQTWTSSALSAIWPRRSWTRRPVARPPRMRNALWSTGAMRRRRQRTRAAVRNLCVCFWGQKHAQTSRLTHTHTYTHTHIRRVGLCVYMRVCRISFYQHTYANYKTPIIMIIITHLHNWCL